MIGESAVSDKSEDLHMQDIDECDEFQINQDISEVNKYAMRPRENEIKKICILSPEEHKAEQWDLTRTLLQF